MGSAASREAIRAISDWAITDPRRTPRRPARPKRSAAWCSATPCSRRACPRVCIKALQADDQPRRAARRIRCRRGRQPMKDWAVEHGATHYTHLFQPMTGLTAEKHDSFLSPTRRRQGDRRVQRQGTDQGRARRVELPVRRHALDLRGPRLHRLGPDQPALAPQDRQRQHAGHPHRVRQLDRRGARQEDAAAALDGGAVDAGGAHPEAVRLEAPSASSPPSAPSRNTS